MSQQSNNDNDPEMLNEYDFSGDVRGKYVASSREESLRSYLILTLLRSSQIQSP